MEPEKSERVCDWGYDGGGWRVPLCQPADEGVCFGPDKCDWWVFCPCCGGKINFTDKEVV